MDAVVESFKPVFRMLGGVLALLVVLRIFLLWWNSPKQKGKRGEKLVAGRLRKGLPDEYRILNDIYLPLPDGTTTQIDLRKRKGDGKSFYGCKSYPRCRGIINVE